MSIPESELSYGSILTLIGENAEINGKLNNKPINFTHIAIGDANDVYVQPSRTQTTLVNEITRIPVTGMEKITPSEPDGVPQLKVWAKIPDNIVDIAVREFAAIATFDGNSYLHAVGNSVRIPILSGSNNGGEVNDIFIEMTFAVTSLDPIVMIDPAIVTATRKFVEEENTKHLNAENPHPQYMMSKDGVSLNDFKAVSIKKDYVKIAEVSGASHCAQVRLAITGTGVNFVTNNVWEVSLNHSGHLYVNEYHGGYSGLDLRIYYDSSHNFEVFAKHNGDDFEELLARINLTCWNVGSATIAEGNSPPKYPSYKDFNGKVGTWKTNRHFFAPNLQFIEYDPERVYALGEVCFTRDDQTGELSYWQWYSNVESLSGKDPLTSTNRHTGWTATDKPFYWIPYTGNQSGMPFYWLSEVAPEWAVMEINVDLPVAVYWRLARCYPHLVSGGTINTGEIRGEFLRVLDQGRGVDNSRLINSFQSDEIKSHSHRQADLVKQGASGAGNGTALEAGEINSGTKPTGSYTYTAGGDETRPRNIARPMAIVI